MGACEGAGGDLMQEAFGIVAMVAMTPLIVIQAMGLVYGAKLKTAAVEISGAAQTAGAEASGFAGMITEYDVEAYYD
jgi:hypothetical protein